MKNKHQQKNKQHSFDFEFVSKNTKDLSSSINHDNLDNIISFPTKVIKTKTFRERIKDDLIKNKVIIK